MHTDAPAHPPLYRELYPFRSRFLDLGGARCHYIDEGAGDPVLMVHGNPTWSFYFRNLARGLMDRWRTIAIDHVGCGLSDKPRDYRYTLPQHIDNLERLVDHLRLDRIVLALHDWGGAIGMGFAQRHPDRVRGFVVFNTGAFLLPPNASLPWNIRSCRIPLFGELAIRGLNLFSLAALELCCKHQDRLSPAVRDGYLAPYDSYAHRVAVHRFVQDIPLSPRDPSWGVMRDMEAGLGRFRNHPMLICWGEQDFCFTLPFLDRWQHFFPGAEVKRLPDAGHYVLEDAHERIVPWVRAFLEQRTAR